MRRLLIVSVIFSFAHGAQALLCGDGPGNNLYGFYHLYRDSTYVVLATPAVVETTARGERTLLLKVKKSWRKEPKDDLTISDSPDFYWMSANGGIPDEEQVFFLEHGRNERVSWACGNNAFPVQPHTFESLDQIRREYSNAGLLGPRPPGGLVCMRSGVRKLHENQRVPKMTAQIGDGVKIEFSDVVPVFFSNLDTESSHLMSIRKDGVQVASFWFKFEPGENQRCLYESNRKWKFSSKDCGCTWDDI